MDEKKVAIPEENQELKEKKIDFGAVITALVNGYSDNEDKSRGLRETCSKTISQYLKNAASEHPCSKNYNILLLFDDTRIVRTDADNIYDAITKIEDTGKPLLLVLYSLGGSAGSAYLISKLCREYTKSKFVIVVPRVAKSAATLLCCGADEIHMGSLSDMGPIDPQIDDLPALGLKHSIEHIADLVNAKPKTAELFAKYLNLSLPLINLGYYERVAESAKQYAERLLSNNSKILPETPEKIAHKLVYSYKDHGFVIDKSEATTIFGEEIIKCNTDEYELGNDLYKKLESIQSISKMLKQKFYYIGSFDTNPTFETLR